MSPNSAASRKLPLRAATADQRLYLGLRARGDHQLVAGCGPPGAERIGHRSSTKNTGSLKLAREELWKLWEEEKKIAKRGDHAKWFSRLEVACMTVGTTGSAGRAAATATIPVVSVPVALPAFAGWATC